ncbi:MAG: hypothetical protein ACQEUT_08560 [Bacillota bacterium]
MKVKKAIIGSTLALGLLVGGGSMVAGKTINGFSSTGTFTITATAWFNPSWKVVSGAGYNLKAGENVKQTYVRIQEGSYDSGRVYSSKASSTSTNKEYSVSKSKSNNPFSTMYTNYGWLYF